MAQWTEPVYDRTQADVDYAKSQLSNKVNNVQHKGCFNVLDILRIENNSRYLADVLKNLYYFNKVSTRTDWNSSSLPNVSDVTRIINNVKNIWESYYRPSDSTDLPNTLIRFGQVNDIERNHLLIKEMIDDMSSSFRECGTFGAGEG